MIIKDKIVDFRYCKKCIYKDLSGVEDPCNDCLDNPTNEYSQKPLNYVEDENLKDLIITEG